MPLWHNKAAAWITREAAAWPPSSGPCEPTWRALRKRPGALKPPELSAQCCAAAPELVLRFQVHLRFGGNAFLFPVLVCLRGQLVLEAQNRVA